jgi:RNA polymerase sigma factor (sigma-70 family)
MTFPTDAELARRARRDPDAFLHLYIRHAPGIHRWLRARVRDDEAALDLTAETFARALTVIRRYRADSGAFAAWLHGIAQNLLLVYFRERRVETAARERLRIPLGPYAGEFEDADRRLVAEARRAELAAALEVLPDTQREALELRVLEQLPYEEIGSRLGCSTGAARVRVTRALRSLHSHFEGARP